MAAANRTAAEWTYQYLRAMPPAIGSGGDSHGRLIYDMLVNFLANNQVSFPGWVMYAQHFASGGSTTSTYLKSREYVDLWKTASHDPKVVLLALGSNDLDGTGNVMELIFGNLVELYRQLTERGKIVYILEAPTRFTVRTQGGFSVQDLNKRRMKLQKVCRAAFRGRFITIPGDYFKDDVFETQRCGKVHFKPEYYASLAEKVLTHIRDDLVDQKSPPHEIQPRKVTEH